jgi:hypothetical protein
MFNLLPKSLFLESVNFLRFLKIEPVQMFNKIPFLQKPKKFGPKLLKYLSPKLIDQLYTDNEAGNKRWKGFRLMAVDVSRITLPLIEGVKIHFPETKNNPITRVIKARCSVLYDLENNYVVDAELGPTSQNERSMALSHLSYCKKGDLVLCDRSYPAYAFINFHVINKFDYVIRVKFGFSKHILDFKNSNKKSVIVTINSYTQQKLSDKSLNKSIPIKVRLIKAELLAGQVEIFMSSLLDIKKYPNGIFHSLYYKRKSLATVYDQVENKLNVECFSV